MKYLLYFKIVGDYIGIVFKEKYELIKLQKIEIGVKFENLNKIGFMLFSLFFDFFML